MLSPLCILISTFGFIFFFFLFFLETMLSVVEDTPSAGTYAVNTCGS